MDAGTSDRAADASWSSALAREIRPFTDVRSQYAAFSARPMAVDRVRRFIAANRRGLFVIKGPPGAGKSALAVYLESLLADECGHRPVAFYFRASTPDPATCVRHLHASLVLQHGIDDPAAARLPTDPAQALIALRQLLQAVSHRSSESRRQCLILDALDECHAPGGASDGRVGTELVLQLAADVPDHVYVIVTSQPTPGLAGTRSDGPYGELDFDDPGHRAETLEDVGRYVAGRLASLESPDRRAALAAAITNTADGNYLVARLLCHECHATARGSDDIEAILQDLLKERSPDRLGRLYRRYVELLLNHDRTGGRMGVLLRAIAFAEADVTPALVRAATGLSVEAWLTVRPVLERFLHAEPADPATGRGERIRLFHRSFRDYLRSHVFADDAPKSHGLLEAACRGWADFADESRDYALHHAVFHAVGTSASEVVGRWTSDFVFFEAKAAAGAVAALRQDLDLAARWMRREGQAEAGLVQDLADAILADMPFLERHPETLFQCMWNALWWIDSPEAAEWRPRPAQRSPGTSSTPTTSGSSRDRFMEAWRKWKEQTSPGFSWMRAVTPSNRQPGQCFFLEGHTSDISALDTSADGQTALSASCDGTLRLWDVHAACETRPPVKLEERVDVIRFCSAFPGGGAFLGGDAQGRLFVWNATTLACMAKEMIHDGGITTLAVSASSQWAVVGGRKFCLAVLELPSLRVLARWDADTHFGPRERIGKVASATIDPADDSVLFTFGSDVYRWPWKTGSCEEWLPGSEYGLYTVCEASRDGERFALCQINHHEDQHVGDVVVFDMSEAKHIITLPDDDQRQLLSERWGIHGELSDSVAELRFSRDGSQLAIADTRCTHLFYWRAPATYGSIPLRARVSLMVGGVGCVAFADRSYVLCGTGTGVIQAWNIEAFERGQSTAAIQTPPSLPTAIGLTGRSDFLLDPRGRYFLTTEFVPPESEAGPSRLAIHVGDPRHPHRDLRVLHVPIKSPPLAVRCGAMAESGNRAVFGLASGGFTVVDFPHEATAAAWVSPIAAPQGFAPPAYRFSASEAEEDANDVVESAGDAANAEVIEPAPPADGVTAIAISPQGGSVVAGTQGGWVTIWHDDPQESWVTELCTARITAVAISADETLVAACVEEAHLSLLLATDGGVLRHWKSVPTTTGQDQDGRLVFMHIDAAGRRIGCGFSSGWLRWLDIDTDVWTTVGRVRNLADFDSLAEGWSGLAYRLDRTNHPDVAIVSNNTRQPVAWFPTEVDDARGIVADRDCRIVVVMGGLTDYSKFYVREGRNHSSRL